MTDSLGTGDRRDGRDLGAELGASLGRTVVAATFPDEWRASLMRETLRDAGIPCVMSDGNTGSFRADVPGRVKILVREEDLQRAADAIERRRAEAAAIDWSQVDVGSREDDATSDGAADPDAE